MLNKIKNKFFKTERIENYSKTYSQTGEDSIVTFIANTLGIYPPTYIDIGAYDPFRFSNTAKFYSEGARGINIEPNPEIFPRLASARSKDINLNIGVAAQPGTLTFYMMDAPTLNTFSATEALHNVERWGRKIVNQIDVPVDTVDNIINTYHNGRYPDFLSLDIEDGEITILQTVCLSPYKPKILCVETLEYGESGLNPVKEDIIKCACEFGYFPFANTHLNTIFVQKDIWEAR